MSRQQKILKPAADGTVRSDYQKQTYGIWRSPNVSNWFDWEEMRVSKEGERGTMESYIRFEDLPAANEYSKAYLVLFGVSDAGNGMVRRFTQIENDDWEELKLTWDLSKNFKSKGLYTNKPFQAGMNKIDINDMAKKSKYGELAIKISSVGADKMARYNTKESNTPFLVFMK